MGTSEISKIPYDERTDDQKLESNWKKALGLFERKDFSASVIRVATSAELAANIYIRHFLLTEHKLPSSFVDALLISANGLDGKFNRLVKPAAQHLGTWNSLKAIQKKIGLLHEHRNSVVHSGNFKFKSETRTAFEYGLAIIQGLAPQESGRLLLPRKKGNGKS